MPPVTAAIPMLVCRDGAAEIRFCVAAFRAAELDRRSGPDGSVVHATLSVGGALIMVHGETPVLASRAPAADGSSPVVIYLYLPDVDAAVARAVAAGATIVTPLRDCPWGDRMARVLDPSGHVWNLATRAA
ncbi:MAG TPA: VOC family protein [Opitutaceae bacterium]|nr:VOC family protein [Opitutaceae bacterium]